MKLHIYTPSVSILALLFCQGVPRRASCTAAFQPTLGRPDLFVGHSVHKQESRRAQPCSPHPGHSRYLSSATFYHQKLLPPLRYREHSEEDSDTTRLQLNTRAPVGYDVKEAISQPPPPSPKNGMNMQLVLACLQNQLLILGLATFASILILVFTDGFGVLSHLPEVLSWNGEGTADLDLTITPENLAAGLIGAIPVIALGSLIEQSDNRVFANTNFSTIIMVMTLFGRRKVPPKEFVPERMRGQEMPVTSTFDVALQSLALAGLTGICEELVFRCEVPSLISHYFGPSIPLALLGQAILFGLGHASPGSNPAENAVVMLLQIVNGTLFGLVYLFTGGQIVPCMIAHAAYDFQVFFWTWLSANAQTEYAEAMYLEPFPPETTGEVKRIQTTAKNKISQQAFNSSKKLFYTFDFDKNKTLSLSEVRKGFAYLWLEKASIPPPQRYIDALFSKCIEKRSQEGVSVSPQDSDRLRFADFLRMFVTLQSQTASSR